MKKISYSPKRRTLHLVSELQARRKLGTRRYTSVTRINSAAVAPARPRGCYERGRAGERVRERERVRDRRSSGSHLSVRGRAPPIAENRDLLHHHHHHLRCRRCLSTPPLRISSPTRTVSKDRAHEARGINADYYVGYM